MKPNRRSLVFRAAIWLLTLALISSASLFGNKAEAQGEQTLRVIIADVENISADGNQILGVQARDEIYNELLNAGGRYYPFSEAELRDAAKSVQVRIPSLSKQPYNFSDADLTRLAKQLGADAIVRGRVASGPLRRGAPVTVSLQVFVQDVASGENINGGLTKIKSSSRPGQITDPEELRVKAVTDAAQDVVRQIFQRQVWTATILNVNQNIAIINIGKRNGLQVGDELTVYRQQGRNVVKMGRLKAVRVNAGDAEADILENIGGIQIEDLARTIYNPPFVLSTVGGLEPSRNAGKINFSTVGATLATIGLGVLIAQAARGGQSGLTKVTAESGTENGSAIVRVRYTENIFTSNVLQFKIFRLPDFPFGTVGTGGNNNNNNGAGVPVGTTSPTVREFIDHASPNFYYANGNGFLVGTTNGGVNNGNNTGGGNNNNQGCGTPTQPGNAATLDVGFRPGNSYRYQVTAVFQRQSNLSGGGNNGGGGGGGGNGNTGGVDCVESDPVQSGLSTPIVPVILSSPNDQTGSIDISRFQPTWSSRSGADIFQLEISTDRNFRTPSRIFRILVNSTAPNSNGVTQTLPTPINLAGVPELIADPVFAAYLNSAGGANVQLPFIYWRVGARHDDDVPGPIHFISQNPSDNDRNFRFVYGTPFSFQPTLLPPPPPGRAASLLNRKINSGNRSTTVLPLPGDTSRGRGTALQRVLTPQEILSGRGRIRR